MKTLRLAIATVTLVLMTAGYAASQYAYFNGTASAYASKVDVPAVSYLAFALFLAIVVLGFVPDRSAGDIEVGDAEEKAKLP